MTSPSPGRGASACAQSASIATLSIPADPKTRMKRKATAAALTEAGYPVTSATLSTLAARRDVADRGPDYCVFGRCALYEWGVALAWAQGRMRPRTERRPGTADRAAA